MAISFMAAAKMEKLLLRSVPSSSSGFISRAVSMPLPHLGSLKSRGLDQRAGAVRCAAAFPGAASETQRIDTSSLSALAQLNANAADRYTKERSCIAVIGVNIHTAPVQMREKLAISEADWPQAIQELCGLNHIEEAAVLSTCNRMEIYVVALSRHRGVREVTEWMSKTYGIPLQDLCQHRFLLYDKDATRHLFEVSAGLNSLVLGECQILAQVRQVEKVGQGVDGFGRIMSSLFKHAITVGKRVRTETNIASGAVSSSSAAVELALMKIPRSSHTDARMLVVGAGKMGKLVIKHLVAKGSKRIVVVNRSEEKVAAIREELKGVEIIYRPVSDMLACAAEADVIFTSSDSKTPLFTKENVKDLPAVGSEVGGVRLFVDISVPRNVGSCVSEVSGARVYNVDDLEEVVAANKEDRLRKAKEAHPIISEVFNQFNNWRDSLGITPTIKMLRDDFERITQAELEKYLPKMGLLSEEMRGPLHDLARGIGNKLLHGPMQHLRCDEGDGRPLDEVLENNRALIRMYSLGPDLALTKTRAKTKQNRK